MSSLSRNYEVILIAHPESAEGDITKLQGQFSELVSRHGGKILDTANLGRRKLSYKIKKTNEGVYLLVRLQMPPGEVMGLRRASSMMDSVLRFFIVEGITPSGNGGERKSDSDDSIG